MAGLLVGFLVLIADRGVAAVEFRTADLPMLAEGTCLQGKPEYLEVPVTEDWQTKGTMGPKEKADMIRLMVSNRHHGSQITDPPHPPPPTPVWRLMGPRPSSLLKYGGYSRLFLRLFFGNRGSRRNMVPNYPFLMPELTKIIRGNI